MCDKLIVYHFEHVASDTNVSYEPWQYNEPFSSITETANERLETILSQFVPIFSVAVDVVGSPESVTDLI